MGKRKWGLSRREFVAGAAACAGGILSPAMVRGIAAEEISTRPSVSGADFTPIAEVFLDLHRVHKWDDSMGDTWDPFWSDDDSLYAFNCDGRGFGKKSMNLAFNRLAGDAPDALAGSQVNEMDEYGKANQKESDNATWKACGQECIDGVFYAFVSRNVYGSDSKDPLLRQLAFNSSLIKSTDRGKTWTRTAKENYDKPMWPGSRFGAPFFLHDGRNGGQAPRDGATEHVYVCSTNGFWNDGDSLILGRVKRAKLAELNSGDWEYLASADGSTAESWSSEIAKAIPILDRPAKCGQTPITYVPELGSYVLISWYNTEKMTKWYEPNEMRYDFYQAPRPWGPWKQVGWASDKFLGPGYHMYGPSLCARFQERRGTDVELSLFTSGCPFEDVPASPYKMWHIPVILRTKALGYAVEVPAVDTKVHYEGSWFAWTTAASSAEKELPRSTITRGDHAELTFTGTGIEYIAEKSIEQGKVDVYIDGARQESTSLKLDDFPVFLGVTVFARRDLPNGQHTIRVVNAGEARINVQRFRVYA
jgi:hypothetical protein